ncbi:MAG: glycosyltransferase [Chloroflexota bacterium]
MMENLFSKSATDRKLAVFLPDLSDGGAERITLNLIHEILARNIPVDLVLVDATGPFRDQIPAGTNVIDLKSKRVTQSLFKLRRYLVERRPDALLSTMVHANVVSLFAHRLANVPTRIFLAQHNTFSLSNQSEPAAVRMMMPQLVRWTYRWADRVIVVSHGMATDLIEFCRLPYELITMIYNPVITPAVNRKAKAEIDHPWFEAGSPPVIMGVGRLSPVKNFTLLIDAFAKLRQQQEARLIILGEGDQRETLEAKVQQHGLEEDVSLPGFVSNPYPYMKHADLFVLSSNYEGLPTVLIEALYLGMRVVSTDCKSGPREILADIPQTHLVPVNDLDRLSAAMSQALLEDPPPIKQTDWQPYELNQVVDQYLETLFENAT